MSDAEELRALRRLAALEAKAGGMSPADAAPATAAQLQPEAEAPSSFRIAAEAPAKAVNTFADQVLNTPTRLANLGIAGVGSLANAAGFPEYAPDPLPDPNWIRHFTGEGTKPVGAFQEGLDKTVQFATLALTSPNKAFQQLVQNGFSAVAAKLAVKEAAKTAGVGGASGAVGDVVGRATGSQTAELVANMATPFGIAGAAKIGPAVAGVAGDALATTGALLRVHGAKNMAVQRQTNNRTRDVVGDDAAEVTRAVNNVTRNTVTPTVGDALAENTLRTGSRAGSEVIKLQDELTGFPGTGDVLNKAIGAQDEAMLGPLQRLAGGATREAQDAAQAAARTTRKQGAGAQYEALAPTPVQLDGQLIALLQSSAGKQAMTIAQKIANNEVAASVATGKQPIPFFIRNGDGKITGMTAQGLQNVKSALDSIGRDKALQAQLGIEGTGLKAIGDVRNALVGWMNRKIPGWENARNQYSAESQPINQLQVGQTLVDKFKAESGKPTPNQFLNATGRGEESMLRKSAGGPRDSTLETIFAPNDAASVRSVGADLNRRAEMQRIAGSMKGTQQQKAGAPQLPNPLSGKIAMVNYVLRNLGVDLNSGIAAEMARRMITPQDFIRPLQQQRPSAPWSDAINPAMNAGTIGALLQLE